MNEVYKRIHDKANELSEAKGKRPTLAELRSALGGGSFTTISEAMKVWKPSEQQQIQSELSPVPDVLQGSFLSVWKQAQQLAHDALAVEREALQKSRFESEQVQAELGEVVEQLEGELVVSRERFERAEKELLEMRLALERSTAQLERLNRLEEELSRAQQAERIAISEAAELRGELKAKR